MNKKAFFSSLFGLSIISLIFLSYIYSFYQETAITDITDVKREFFLARNFLDKYLSWVILQDAVATCGAMPSPYSANVSGFSNYYPDCTLILLSDNISGAFPNYTYTATYLLRCQNDYAYYENTINFQKNIVISNFGTPPPTYIFNVNDAFSNFTEASDVGC